MSKASDGAGWASGTAGTISEICSLISWYFGVCSSSVGIWRAYSRAENSSSSVKPNSGFSWPKNTPTKLSVSL